MILSENSNSNNQLRVNINCNVNCDRIFSCIFSYINYKFNRKFYYILHERLLFFYLHYMHTRKRNNFIITNIHIVYVAFML